MSRVSLLLLLALVPGWAAWADLGDTMSESELKYGPPTATGSPQIWTYTHDRYHIWQIYDGDGVCIVAEFRLMNNGPFTPAQCAELDHANLPTGLEPGDGPGWDITKWPDNSTDRDTVSWQYTGVDGAIYFQGITGQSRSDNIGWYFYRVYLTGTGIEVIKSLQGGR
jgi:hypothetical protein